MKNIDGLDHIGIRVGDFPRSIEFYKAFGFQLLRSDFQEGVMVLVHKRGPTLNLLDSAIESGTPHNILMDESIKHAGYTHIALKVNQITEAIDHINKLGHVITEGPVRFGDGKTSIFIRDPDKNVIEFTQHKLPADSAMNGINKTGGAK
tara:strand:- start:1960 stop:2406 length:447 start_codon:yes stop_codon:yes gene_type:complete